MTNFKRILDDNIISISFKVVAPSAANGDFDFLTAPPTQQRMVGMEECPLHLRKGRLFCLAINAKFV